MAKVTLKDVRLGFPALFTAKAVNDGDKPKFSASFPIVLDSENAKALKRAMQQVAKEKWGEKWEGIYRAARDDKRLCYMEREKTSSGGDVFTGFEGHGYLNASSDIRPTVVDRAYEGGKPKILTEKDGRPYGGCYVHAIVDIWAQDNKHGKRINAQLQGVQFYRDGDAFAGGVAASPDSFEDLGDGSDDGDLVGEASADDLI